MGHVRISEELHLGLSRKKEKNVSYDDLLREMIDLDELDMEPR